MSPPPARQSAVAPAPTRVRAGSSSSAGADAGAPLSANPRPNREAQARVEEYIVEQYAAGRSLRELVELTDRSFSAVRSILTRRGVHRRTAGAAVMRQPDVDGSHGSRAIGTALSA